MERENGRKRRRESRQLLIETAFRLDTWIYQIAYSPDSTIGLRPQDINGLDHLTSRLSGVDTDCL
jgi:hypothetical protein